jgi:hypothetical protein
VMTWACCPPDLQRLFIGLRGSRTVATDSAYLIQ